MGSLFFSCYPLFVFSKYSHKSALVIEKLDYEGREILFDIHLSPSSPFIVLFSDSKL